MLGPGSCMALQLLGAQWGLGGPAPLIYSLRACPVLLRSEQSRDLCLVP